MRNCIILVDKVVEKVVDILFINLIIHVPIVFK